MMQAGDVWSVDGVASALVFERKREMMVKRKKKPRMRRVYRVS